MDSTEIDADHQRFIRLVNELNQAIMSSLIMEPIMHLITPI
jgi:hypothetical protein